MSKELCITLIVLSMLGTGLFWWLAAAEGVRHAEPPEPGQKPKKSLEFPLSCIAWLFCAILVYLLFWQAVPLWSNSDYIWYWVVGVILIMAVWYGMIQTEWPLPKKARIGYQTRRVPRRKRR